MALYEYRCEVCDGTFELWRSFSQADDPADCPECQSSAVRRLMSSFFAKSASNGGTRSVAGGGGCAACSSGTCAGCGIAG